MFRNTPTITSSVFLVDYLAALLSKLARKTITTSQLNHIIQDIYILRNPKHFSREPPEGPSIRNALPTLEEIPENDFTNVFLLSIYLTFAGIKSFNLPFYLSSWVYTFPISPEYHTPFKYNSFYEADGTSFVLFGITVPDFKDKCLSTYALYLSLEKLKDSSLLQEDTDVYKTYLMGMNKEHSFVSLA